MKEVKIELSLSLILTCLREETTADTLETLNVCSDSVDSFGEDNDVLQSAIAALLLMHCEHH